MSWILFPLRHRVWCPMDKEDSTTEKEEYPVSNVLLYAQIWVKLMLVETSGNPNDWIHRTHWQIFVTTFFLCLILPLMEKSLEIQSKTLNQWVLTVFVSHLITAYPHFFFFSCRPSNFYCTVRLYSSDA